MLWKKKKPSQEAKNRQARCHEEFDGNTEHNFTHFQLSNLTGECLYTPAQ